MSQGRAVEEDAMPFTDRTDAGRRLAAALASYAHRDVVVLALPRGGVPVAAEVAAALDAPLDVLLVRKIGSPLSPELAMGAVAEGGATVHNRDVMAMMDVAPAAFAAAREVQLAEIERRRRAYVGSRTPTDIAGRIAIVVDDGVATGATTRAALRAVRARRPSALILATPVAPPDVLAALRDETDGIVCLEALGGAGAIGAHYLDFRQLEDDEVIAILSRTLSDGAD